MSLQFIEEKIKKIKSFLNVLLLFAFVSEINVMNAALVIFIFLCEATEKNLWLLNSQKCNFSGPGEVVFGPAVAVTTTVAA